MTNNLQKIKQKNRQILKSCHRRENKMTRTNTTGSIPMIITSTTFNTTKHMRSCSEMVPPLREKISSTMLITTKTRRAANEAVSPRFTQGSLNGLFHKWCTRIKAHAKLKQTIRMKGNTMKVCREISTSRRAMRTLSQNTASESWPSIHSLKGP